MQVKVQYLGMIRSKLGKKEEVVNLNIGASLSILLDKRLLDKLVEIYGKDLFNTWAENILDPTFIVTVNGVLTD